VACVKPLYITGGPGWGPERPKGWVIIPKYRCAELKVHVEATEQPIAYLHAIADLIATAAGRDLRVKEIRFLESLETKDLNTFTAMFTDAINGYAAQGSYHSNDRFEDKIIRITTI